MREIESPRPPEIVWKRRAERGRRSLVPDPEPARKVSVSAPSEDVADARAEPDAAPQRPDGRERRDGVDARRADRAVARPKRAGLCPRNPFNFAST